jgi:hypothetical protein
VQRELERKDFTGQAGSGTALRAGPAILPPMWSRP